MKLSPAEIGAIASRTAVAMANGLTGGNSLLVAVQSTIDVSHLDREAVMIVIRAVASIWPDVGFPHSSKTMTGEVRFTSMHKAEVAWAAIEREVPFTDWVRGLTSSVNRDGTITIMISHPAAEGRIKVIMNNLVRRGGEV